MAASDSYYWLAFMADEPVETPDGESAVPPGFQKFIHVPAGMRQRTAIEATLREFGIDPTPLDTWHGGELEFPLEHATWQWPGRLSHPDTPVQDTGMSVQLHPCNAAGINLAAAGPAEPRGE